MDKTVDAQVEQLVTETMAKLTHKENCVMVTIGGNKVGWTSKDGRKFSFTFFDEGVEEGSGSWANVLGDEMGDYGITARKGAGAVLGSLQKKGLLVTNGAPDETEGNWWSLTALGAKVALALNEKDWK
jgi:2-keto-4-pentenoate hydratase